VYQGFAKAGAPTATPAVVAISVATVATASLAVIFRIASPLVAEIFSQVASSPYRNSIPKLMVVIEQLTCDVVVRVPLTRTQEP
jgi:hypothetical protein